MHLSDSVMASIVYQAGANGTDEYMDNFRAYRIRGRKHFAEFLRLERAGCCGSAYGDAVDENGDRWVTGWNYGH